MYSFCDRILVCLLYCIIGTLLEKELCKMNCELNLTKLLSGCYIVTVAWLSYGWSVDVDENMSKAEIGSVSLVWMLRGGSLVTWE